jgi:hypothetical protein
MASCQDLKVMSRKGRRPNHSFSSVSMAGSELW